MATCKHCGKPLILSGGKCLYCGKASAVQTSSKKNNISESSSRKQIPHFNVIKRYPTFRFDIARNFSEGLALVTVDKYKAGYIDKNGQWAIEPNFYHTESYDFRNWIVDYRFQYVFHYAFDMFDFSQGLAAAVWLDKKRGLAGGYIDSLGNIVIRDIRGGSFHEDLAYFYKQGKEGEGKYGYINRQGKIVIQPIFTAANIFSNGIAAAWVDDKPTFIDREGNALFKNNQFEILHTWGGFYEDLALVQVRDKENNKKKVGFIDRQGNFRKPTIGTFYHNFSDGLAITYWGDDDPGRTIYIDKNMNVVIDKRFSYLIRFREGKAAARDDSTGESGYIDKKGNFIIHLKFDMAAPFSEGMAAFQLNGKIGFINSTGEIVIPPQFDSARHFSEGFAAVSKNGKWSYIDKSGNIVF